MYGHMLNQTITIARLNGTDDYSDETYDAATTAKARVELTNKSKWTSTGEVIPIAAKVWVDPALMIDAGDKITYASINYKVLGRREVPDGTGKVRLVEMECTEWR